MLLSRLDGYERSLTCATCRCPAVRLRSSDRRAWRWARSHALGLLDHPGAAPLRSRLAEGEERTLLAMIEHGVNSPLTSSMGRLFDTVAAIVGVADDARYEGEAAILLEAAADRSASGAYEFELIGRAEPGDRSSSMLAPMLADSAGRRCCRNTLGVISMRFHRAVVGCIVAVSEAVARARRHAPRRAGSVACS